MTKNPIIYFALLFVVSFTSIGFSQSLKLKNAVVIGQFDKSEDRYAIEVSLTELLTQSGVKAMPSLNLLKKGASATVLSNDSLQKQMKAAGYDTYLVVNVKGYDHKFKPSTSKVTFAEVLEMTSIYHLYRDEATSVSFDFTFFRDNQVVYREVFKCGNVSDRDSVLKKFRKKMTKVIAKNWK